MYFSGQRTIEPWQRAKEHYNESKVLKAELKLIVDDGDKVICYSLLCYHSKSGNFARFASFRVYMVYNLLSYFKFIFTCWGFQLPSQSSRQASPHSVGATPKRASSQIQGGEPNRDDSHLDRRPRIKVLDSGEGVNTDPYQF